MGRQNVGTPKFYVDLIQYWHAKGLVAGIGPYHDAGGPYEGTGASEYGNTMPEGYSGSNGQNYTPEFIGFNPYNYLFAYRYWNTYSSDIDHSGYLDNLLLLKEKVLLPSGGKMFVSYLNHSFAHCGAKLGPKSILTVYKSWSPSLERVSEDDEYSGFGSEWISGSCGAGSSFSLGGDSQDDEGNLTEDSSLTEICNFPDYDGGLFNYNGFSIAEFDATEINGINDKDDEFGNYVDTQGGDSNAGIYGFDTMIWQLNSDRFNAQEDVDDPLDEYDEGASKFVLGSFNFGISYTMPQSPDLSLTMEREFDGIDKQTTKGGATLTQINYDGPPKWRDNLGAWELHSTASITDKKYLVRDKMTRGRRVWRLKFSHISSDDLFSPTELFTTQSGSVGPSYDGDYPDGDFANEGSTAFEDNFNQSNSFFSVVMSRTMGGKLPFMFQPDSNNNSADQFAICEIVGRSIKIKQTGFKTYDISLRIREIW